MKKVLDLIDPRLAFYFLIFILGLLIGIYTVRAECLTENQTQVLENLNLTDLIPIFESLCNKSDTQFSNLETQISILSSRIETIEDNTYNKTEILELIPDDYLNRTEAEKMEARINWNISELEKKKADKADLDDLQDNVSKIMERKKEELIDIFDTKVRKLREEFLTLDEYENHSSTLKLEIYRMVENQLSVWDRYALYIFLTVCIGIGTFAFIYKYKPQLLRKPFLKNPKYGVRTIEELTTSSDLKQKIENIRTLKLNVLKNKELTKKQKVQLLQKIDKGEIWDMDTLSREIELMKLEEKIK